MRKRCKSPSIDRGVVTRIRTQLNIQQVRAEDSEQPARLAFVLQRLEFLSRCWNYSARTSGYFVLL